jgi:hypothetical protein
MYSFKIDQNQRILQNIGFYHKKPSFGQGRNLIAYSNMVLRRSTRLLELNEIKEEEDFIFRNIGNNESLS